MRLVPAETSYLVAGLFHTHMEVIMKTCTRCNLSKDLTDFARDSSKKCGTKSICKSCDRKKANAYYAANREKKAEHYQSVRDGKIADYYTDWAAAIEVYGGCCVECGVTGDLHFDHVNYDGKEHRAVESPRAMRRRIARTGRPIDDYELQLLCSIHHREKTANEQRKVAA